MDQLYHGIELWNIIMTVKVNGEGGSMAQWVVSHL